MLAAGMLTPLSWAQDDRASGAVGREDLSIPRQAAMNVTTRMLRRIRSEPGKEVMRIYSCWRRRTVRDRDSAMSGTRKRHNDSEIRAIGIANRGTPMQATRARVVRRMGRSLARRGCSLMMRCFDGATAPVSFVAVFKEVPCNI
jgi:hypothetical protein